MYGDCRSDTSDNGGLYVTASKDGGVWIWVGFTTRCMQAITSAHGSAEATTLLMVFSVNHTNFNRNAISFYSWWIFYQPCIYTNSCVWRVLMSMPLVKNIMKSKKL
jgi:hypothetical protein